MEIDVQTNLEIYKIYVDSMEKVATRRQISNNFFLAMNSSLFLGSALVTRIYEVKLVSYLCISLVGVVLCFIWIKVNKNFNSLNTAKFKIIHKLESKLPSKPFEDEWVELKEGKAPSKYKPFSLIEYQVARVFILFYIISFVSYLLNVLC